MSIETEITRISTNVSETLNAVSEMGGTVPENATSNDMANGVRSIPVGAKINDSTSSPTTTYSSQKIDSEISKLNEAKANNADLAAVAKSGSYNDLSNKPTIPTVPSSLPNPNALTFTGAVNETYDGSAAKSVSIPTVPESIKNPNKLTFTGAVTAEYDGSAPVSVEIPSGGGYNLPIASATQLGGVMPVAKTGDMTQAVGVDEAGGLWTKAGGGSSGGYAIDTLLDVTVEEEVQYIYQALDGSHKYSQIRMWTEIKQSSQNTSNWNVYIRLNSTESNLWSGTDIGRVEQVCNQSTDYWGDCITFLGPKKSVSIFARYNNQQVSSGNMSNHALFRMDAWDIETPVTSIRIDVGNWQGWLGVGTHILVQGVRA